MLAVAFDAVADRRARRSATAGRMLALVRGRAGAATACARWCASVPDGPSATRLSHTALEAIRRAAREPSTRHARRRQPLRRVSGGRRGPAVADDPQRLARDGPGDPRPPPCRAPDGGGPASRSMRDADGAARHTSTTSRGRGATPTRTAARWPATSRDMCRSIAVRSPIETETIACDHNHVRPRDALRRNVWVHRKGAMPAGEGDARRPARLDGHAELPRRRARAAVAACIQRHGAGRALSRECGPAAVPARATCGGR